MHYHAHITGIKESETGTYLKVLIPDEQIQKKILKARSGNVVHSEIRIDDNRTITSLQRKKAYATIRDIAYFTGDDPEYLKEFLKFDFCGKTGIPYFSLSNCSITTARHFITHLIDFILEHDIPLSDAALNRTDDIDRYLWSCIKYKRCCITGKPGDIHHWDAIGMGRDRKVVDDSGNRKICLIRELHQEAHQIGREAFTKKYHVYGIIWRDEDE